MYCFKIEYLFIALIFLFVSCQNQEKEGQQEVAIFFDIEKKVAEDIQRLYQENYALNKIVSFEGKMDTTSVAQPDWNTELETLKQLNINKNEWADKYTVDTVLVDNQSTITYEAIKSGLPVSKMILSMSDGEITEIFVSYGRKNILFTSKNEIRYVPFNQYEIKGSQKALFLSSHKYEVLGKMIQTK